MRTKTNKIVRSWKASPEDQEILAALKKAKVGRCESDRVREGIRSLARENGIKVTA
jgi:hypothetical protein